MILGVLIFPNQAKAFCSGCCPIINDAGEIAYAGSMTVLDELAGQVVEEKLNQFLDLSGDNTGTEKEIQAAMKSYEGVALAAVGTLKQHATAMRTTQLSRYYSPLSQSAFACCNSQKGAIAASEVDQRLLIDKLYDATQDYNVQWQSTSNKIDQAKADWIAPNSTEVVNSENIFPLAETLTTEQLQGGYALANFITNPNPAPVLKGGQLSTPAGQQYEIVRNIMLARLAPSQKAMSLLLASKAPIYPLQDWAEQLYEATGRTGTPPAVVEGKLSESSVIATQVNSRYANPNYLIDLHRKSENGLIRELEEIAAIKLKILAKRLEVAEHTRVILATQVASRLDTEYDPILEATDKAVIEHKVQ